MSISNDVVELSGVPTSGKSTIIKNNKLMVFDVCYLYPLIGKIPKSIAWVIEDTILLFTGIHFLSLKELILFIKLAFNENAGVFYKFNIIRNILKKFAIYSLIQNSTQDKIVYVDEGVSHIPFNFLNTNPDTLIAILRPYLKNIRVKYIYLENDNKMHERLKRRGHPRLRFESIESFIKKNRRVEACLLSVYPGCCVSFEIVKND